MCANPGSLSCCTRLVKFLNVTAPRLPPLLLGIITLSHRLVVNIKAEKYTIFNLEGGTLKMCKKILSILFSEGHIWEFSHHLLIQVHPKDKSFAERPRGTLQRAYLCPPPRQRSSTPSQCESPPCRLQWGRTLDIAFSLPLQVWKQTVMFPTARERSQDGRVSRCIRLFTDPSPSTCTHSEVSYA